LCVTLDGRVTLRDFVVVGAGPAGLSAAAELSPRGDCLLLEQGRGHRERDRHDPREILAGIGGAGLFSDGKHSFHPSASGLWTLPAPAQRAAAFDRTAALLARHGVAATPWTPEPDPPLVPGAWQRKHYPSIYMPLARRMAAIAELERACPQRWTAEVLGAERDGDVIRLRVLRDGAHHDLRTRALVVATGRLSPRWIRPWLTALGARFAFRRLEFGVRIESAADAPLFRQLAGTDPKLRLRDPGGDELRTFCVCRDGEVLLGEALDRTTDTTIAAWSGRADGPPTGRSNLGLLVRTHDESFARAVEPALFSAAPLTLPLRAATPTTLAPIFSPAGAAAVVRALAELINLCPPLADDRAARVHAPCIEGVGDYPADDGALQVAPDVWLAGDVCGRFRGIVASMISGRYVAARITRTTR
jgi:hypothetical protein